jgi:hypothetical protein
MAYRQAMQADTAEFRRRSCVAVTSHLDAFHNSVRKAHMVNKLRGTEIVKPDNGRVCVFLGHFLRVADFWPSVAIFRPSIFAARPRHF